MFPARTFTPLEAFAPAVDPLGLAGASLAFWTDFWRAGAHAAVWWTERWLEAPAMLFAFAAQAQETPPPPVGGTVIRLVDASAPRPAPEPSLEREPELAPEPPLLEAEPVVIAAQPPAAPPQPDDLTRLVGIGPKLAAALAERGVTRFGQIAAWTEQDLSEVDRALSLKGRAVREAWVAQARRLAADA